VTAKGPRGFRESTAIVFFLYSTAVM